MHKIIISLSLIFILISACTEDGDIYDSKKHKKSEFSAEKTIGLIIGAAIVGAAASEYSGGGSSGIIDYDYDWDYQAGAWQRDNGVRIDHLMLSPEAADRLVEVGVDKAPRGLEKPSDHTPIWCDLDI